MREPGRRERKKAEKEAAIRDAAAALFREQGFEATTTQAVAERAGVAKGTVFLYATTKVDLVALVFAERIRRVATQALAAAPHPDLVADLDALFARFFSMYAKERELARIFVRELAFASGDAQATRTSVDIAFLTGLAARFETHRARGTLRADVDARTAAFAAFALYLTTLMAWLASDTLKPKAARARLRAALELLVRGLGPIAGEEEPT